MEEHAKPPRKEILGDEFLQEKDEEDWDIGVESEVESGELSSVVTEVEQ